MNETTDRVAPEVALNEFERWADAMDLDLDVSQMDADDNVSFVKQKRRILRAIRRGSLVIDEKGLAVYTPSNSNSKCSDPLTFTERSGASLMAMDGKKQNHDVAKTYAMMGDICQVPPKVFAGMVGEDIKICEALFVFLMD
jgi:hypothetical protein